MANGLPDNFTERWIRLENNVEHMAVKLGKIDPADVENLKADMSRIKGIGGTIFTGLVIGLGWAWRKILSGGV